MQYYNGNKADCLKRLYKAHDIITDITERIENLYASATSISPINNGMPKTPNPRRFEGIMVEVADLKTLAQTLLKKRASFDLFVCSLPMEQQRLLKLRCEECRTWKEIAYAMSISNDTAERLFKRICDQAEAKGIFNT